MLKSRWLELTGHFMLPSTAETLWEKIELEYSQPPGRAYHNLGHIEECFARFDKVLELVNNRLAVELAIFFHDIVYDPKSTVRFENEEKSAELAAALLSSAGFPSSECAIVANLILDTRHAEVAKSADGRLLVDIDLSILASAEERFWLYEDQIREEYSWVEADAYRSGRVVLMQGFLDRPQIYQTGYFFDQCEAQARKNLAALIQKLSSG